MGRPSNLASLHRLARAARAKENKRLVRVLPKVWAAEDLARDREKAIALGAEVLAAHRAADPRGCAERREQCKQYHRLRVAGWRLRVDGRWVSPSGYYDVGLEDAARIVRLKERVR